MKLEVLYTQGKDNPMLISSITRKALVAAAEQGVCDPETLTLVSIQDDASLRFLPDMDPINLAEHGLRLFHFTIEGEPHKEDEND
jgi:hypothetical protein